MIELSNVSKKIKNKDILVNISHKFEEGKCVLITGHNGSGKTMLLRMICGLIKPDSGHINCNGKEV